MDYFEEISQVVLNRLWEESKKRIGLAILTKIGLGVSGPIPGLVLYFTNKFLEAYIKPEYDKANARIVANAKRAREASKLKKLQKEIDEGNVDEAINIIDSLS